MTQVINRSIKGLEEKKVWRYMSISKFISLIRTSNICFSRISCFEDPNEGRTKDYDKFVTDTRAALERGIKFEGYEGNKVQELLERGENNRKNSFISCWHLNEEESVAMWDLYVGKSEPGIAIQTTVSTLNNIFPRRIEKNKILIKDIKGDEICKEKKWFGMRKVDYYYDSDEAFKNNYDVQFSKIFIKRPYFSYEKEFRVSINADNIDGDYLFVNLCVKELINRIYISPRVNKWIRYELVELIKLYNKQFDFLESEENQIIQSSIFDKVVN